MGYLSYDVVRYFERLPETATDDLNMPDAAFLLADTLVIFDHAKHQLIILANAHNTGDPDAAYDDAVQRIDQIIDALAGPLPYLPEDDQPHPVNGDLQSNMTREQYEANVRAAKEYIAAGDAFQIVLSQRFSRQTSAPPFTIYRALRALNPSPYMFFLHFQRRLQPDRRIAGNDGPAGRWRGDGAPHRRDAPAWSRRGRR